MDGQITPLQSSTIRAALKAIAVNFATIITLVTGWAFDIDAISRVVEFDATVAICLVNIYYAFRAIQGRISATQTIAKKE